MQDVYAKTQSVIIWLCKDQAKDQETIKFLDHLYERCSGVIVSLIMLFQPTRKSFGLELGDETTDQSSKQHVALLLSKFVKGIDNVKRGKPAEAMPE